MVSYWPVPLPHAPFYPPVPHSICPLQVMPALPAQPVPRCLRGRREEVQETMEQREEGDAPAPCSTRALVPAGEKGGGAGDDGAAGGGRRAGAGDGTGRPPSGFANNRDLPGS